MEKKFDIDETKIKDWEHAIRKARRLSKSEFNSVMPVPENDLEAKERLQSLMINTELEVIKADACLLQDYGFDTRNGQFASKRLFEQFLENEQFRRELVYFAMTLVAHNTLHNTIKKKYERKFPGLTHKLSRNQIESEVAQGLKTVYMSCVTAVAYAWEALRFSLTYHLLSDLARKLGSPEEQSLPVEMVCAYVRSLVNPSSDSEVYRILERETGSKAAETLKLLKKLSTTEVILLIPQLGNYKDILRAPGKVEYEIVSLFVLESDRRKRLGKRSNPDDRMVNEQVDLSEEMLMSLTALQEKFESESGAIFTAILADDIFAKAKDKLSPAELEVFSRKFGTNNMTETEIAEELNCTVGHVRKCNGRAVKKLRNHFLSA